MVLASLPLAAQPPESASPRMTATLELAQQFYYSGDPLWVRVSIGNDGEATAVNPVRTPLAAGFRVVDRATGEPLKPAGEAAGAAKSGAPGKLASHAFYGEVVDLAARFPGLAHPGDYEIGWSAGGLAARGVLVRLIPKYDPEAKYQAEIQTPLGTITLELLAGGAPTAVQAFVDLAHSGFYDGLLFHEVHKDWYIAGGDPSYASTPRTPVAFPAELSAVPLVAGTVVLKPSRPFPPTNGPEFVILLRPEPAWTGHVTVIGQVVQGLAVARSIAAEVNSGRESRPYFEPVRDVTIRTVRVSKRPAAAPGTP